MTKRRLTEEQKRLVEQHAIVASSAVKQVRRLARSQSDWEDLNGCASVALCEAAIGFDPGRGIKFCTYAYRCCVRTLLDHIYDDGLIKTPNWLRRSDATDHQSRPFAEKARAAQSYCFRVPQAMDATRSRDKSNPLIGIQESLTDPAESPEKSDIRIDVQDAINRMPERNQTVIRRHMEGWTDHKIAESLGCSGQWVMTLRHRAYTAIRKHYGEAS